MLGTKTHRIIKWKSGHIEEVDDLVAIEARLIIKINSEELVSMYCTPVQVRELVVGLVMTEGLAEGICTDRMSIEYGDAEVRVEVHAEGEVRREGGTVTSGCVGGITFRQKHTELAGSDTFSVDAEKLREIFNRFHKRSAMHDATGCIHSAALADAEELLAFAEDIGRHNAVDKVLGSAILDSIPFAGKMMLASGRLSSEIVSKCARWGVPIVVSRAAPTALALSIAESSGVTVVGFLRGERFNIYTHPKRIRISPDM